MLKIIKSRIGSFSKLIITLKTKILFIPYKGVKKVDLLIFDNIYPHPVSGFRLEEFTVLLKSFQASKIIMSSADYPIVKTLRRQHKKHVNDLFKINSELRNKVKYKRGFVNVNAELFYCVFLNNIFDNLKWLERYRIPFVFTLYPGGGFQVDNSIIDMKLKKVLGSSMFKKVIVTQPLTRDYLIKKDFCKRENIEYIFGLVVPQASIKKDLLDKKKYLINKTTFDICFCAAKYMSRGEDKGYDVFIDFANKIAVKYDFIRFHVIGGFTEDDIDISLIRDKIRFYGYQNFGDLAGIFWNMDVLISPNKPFVLGKGAFDGFPLGTVVEAVLNGAVALTTDGLNQNSNFIKNEELIIIESNCESIEKEIIDLINKPEKLASISRKGKEKFLKVYSNDTQMGLRAELLRKEIERN